MEMFGLHSDLLFTKQSNSTNLNKPVSQAIDSAKLMSGTPSAPKAEKRGYRSLWKLVESKCF
jgi:hypothetical protein